MNKKSVRLPRYVLPSKYRIQLKPDFDNFTFSGVESISIGITQNIKSITLHSKDIDIETASLESSRFKVFADKISYDVKADTTTFHFKNGIKSGKYKLNIVFQGILNDKMRGFYRSKYNLKGKDVYMATTQFEATDARRAFPCFDEPAHKAVFNVSLVVPKGKTAISNTLPISVAEHEAGFDIVKFAPTPKMSTYLLAFIVGDFEYIERKSRRGVTVRVYTTPGKTHQAHFALDTTVRCLEFYEKYFDIPYPLNTLDMIAIPDFSSLAMENWGAITFREIGLLVDEDKTSTSSKELIAEVIAHELAHQWFGNLVTMEWWTHLWLNEGFASYIPYLVIEKLFPEWDIWERFTNDTQGVALRLDALKTTHPIEVEVHHPDEIGEIFDAVSYSKGASIIRMLAEYIGEQAFRDGLRHYLKKHSYKNTETLHLWQSFEKSSGKKVAKMMQNWTAKPGYPVVKAEIKNNNLVLSQERFFSSPISKSKAKDKTIWQIPIKFLKIKLAGSTQKSETEGYLLSRASEKFDFGKFALKLNPEESGFYRVSYSSELLEALREPVEQKKLSSSDRLGIVRDLFALAESSDINTSTALHFLSAYRKETDYVVWAEIAAGLAKVSKLIAKESYKPNLDILISELFTPLVHKLGWEKSKGEPNTDSLLRSLAISMAGSAGSKAVVKEAKLKFKSKKKVDPDVRSAVYRIVAQNGGLKEYNKLVSLYKKEHFHEEKNRIGDALGYFKNAKILKKVCEFAMSKDVRPQDTIYMLSSVGINPLGRDIWWSFVRSNWKTLVSRYGEGGLSLSRAITALSPSAEAKHFKSFKQFFATHTAPGASRAVEQVLERLESNILWLKRDGKLIAKFLNGN